MSKIYVIAGVYSKLDKDSRIGLRLLEVETGKTIDVSDTQVISAIKHGAKITNAEILDGKLRGSNGDLSRYAKLFNGKLMPNESAPLVVLNQIGDTGYTVSDHTGKVVKAKTDAVIAYAVKNGIANGKVITSGEKAPYISAIYGTYDKVEEQVVPANKAVKIAAEPVKPVDVTEPVKEVSVEKPVKLEKLVFTPEQMAVIKGYYEYANISEDIANREIENLNEVIKGGRVEDECSKLSLLYSIIGFMGDSVGVSDAFGSEISEHIVKFIAVGLPITESLAIKCRDYIKDDIVKFYKAFPYVSKSPVPLTSKTANQQGETLSDILSASEDTFRVASRLYLTELAENKILGDYASKTDEGREKEIKKYALCSKYDINELKCLVATLHSIYKSGMRGLYSIYDSFSDEMSAYGSKEDALLDLYKVINIWSNKLKDCSGIHSVSDTYSKYVLTITGMYPEFCRKGMNDYGVKWMDTPPIKGFDDCLFVSTQISDKLNFNSIEELWECVGNQKNTIYMLAAGTSGKELRQAIRDVVRDNHGVNSRWLRDRLNRLLRRGVDVLNGHDKMFALNSLKDIAKDSGIWNNSDNMDLELAEQVSNNGMRWNELTAAQQDKLGKTIKILRNWVDILYDNEVSSSKGIDNIAGLRAIITSLIAKADMVEMGEVLKKEPYILKLCYNVLESGTVSDKQVRYIENAYETLRMQ